MLKYLATNLCFDKCGNPCIYFLQKILAKNADDKSFGYQAKVL